MTSRLPELRFLAVVFVVIAALVAKIEPASAVPINFQFVGSGRITTEHGRIRDEFTINLLADTDEITQPRGNTYSVIGVSTIDLSIFGKANFLIPTRVFSRVDGLVGFSRTGPREPDIFNVYSFDLAGYELNTELGPVEEIIEFDDFFGTLPTTIGDVTVEILEYISFTASFVDPIPEPATLTLATLSLLTIAYRPRSLRR